MKYLKSFWIFTLVMLWGGVALLVSSSSATEPELIPREVLFGNPVKATPTISPDGKLLAYLAPLDNVLNVWVRTVGAEYEVQAVSFYRARNEWTVLDESIKGDFEAIAKLDQGDFFVYKCTRWSLGTRRLGIPFRSPVAGQSRLCL